MSGYDEPDFTGQYLTMGTWSRNGNTLTYDLDSSDDPAKDDSIYQFTDTLAGNNLSGTYTFGNDLKTWTATKYIKTF